MDKEIEKIIGTKIRNLKLLHSDAIRRRDQAEMDAVGRALRKASGQGRAVYEITKVEAAILKAMATGDRGLVDKLRAQLASGRAALAESLGLPVRALQE